MKGFFAGLGVFVGILWVGAGIWFLKKPMTYSISLIGGADGPTSVFLAGKVSHYPYMALFLVGSGVLAALLGAYVYGKRK